MREILNIRHEEAPIELTETAKYLLDPELLESDLTQAETEHVTAQNRYLALKNQYLPRAWDMRVVNGHALYEHLREYSWKFIEVSEVVTMEPDFAMTVKGPRTAYIRLPQESSLEWFKRAGYEVVFWEPQSSSWHDEAMKMRDLYGQNKLSVAAFEYENQARKVADLWVASGIVPEGVLTDAIN